MATVINTPNPQRYGQYWGGGSIQTVDHFAEGLQSLEAQKQRQFQQGQAGRDFGYQSALQADQLAQRQREAQLNFQATMAGQRNQADIARVQANAAMHPANLQNARWKTMWDAISPVIGQGGTGWGSGYQGQGQVGQQPYISDAPVATPAQIQQRVNATRAQNDAAMAARQRQVQNEMAGKGMGARSPLALQLGQQAYNQNLAANTQAENNLRWQAAQGNADQVLKAQGAREQQFASRQQEEIERNKTYSGYINSLLSALIGSV